jgi:predicted GNAT family acetyltransferase
MASDGDGYSVQDNPTLSRFELHEGGETAFADYIRLDDLLIIPHVEAPLALRGGGAAGRLMQGVLERARAAGLKVRPTCSYALAFMRRNPQYDDVRG